MTKHVGYRLSFRAPKVCSLQQELTNFSLFGAVLIYSSFGVVVVLEHVAASYSQCNFLLEVCYKNADLISLVP